MEENPSNKTESEPRLSRRRIVLFTAILLLVLLGAMEFAARFFVFPPGRSVQLVPDDFYGYIPFNFEPFTVGDKPEGAPRVLLLGDSFSFGSGASETGADLASVMEESLRQSVPNLEVVNAGVIGWGPSDELRFLEREGERLSPDIVVVQVFLGNDATDETGMTRIALFQGRPVLAANVETAPGRAWTWARLHIRLCFALSGAIRNAPLLMARQEAVPPFPDIEWRTLMKRKPWLEGEFYTITKGGDPLYDAGFEGLLESLKRIGYASLSLGARPMFVLVPGRLQAVAPLREYAFKLNGIDPAEQDLGKLNCRIVPEMQEHGFNVLDLLPLIQQRAPGDPLLYHTGHDDHFNDKGHRFAGEAMAQWIRENAEFRTQNAE
jgi:lysophospholipase L1-like esterase